MQPIRVVVAPVSLHNYYFCKMLLHYFYIVCFAMLFCCESILAQNQSLEVYKGKVVDLVSSKPLINVHIVNLNKAIGTVTNKEGKFKINAAATDTIHISIIGFKTKRVLASKLSVTEEFTEIELVEDVFQLDEISIYNVPTPEEFPDAFMELELPDNYVEINLPQIADVPAVKHNPETNMPTYTIKGPITALYMKFSKYQRMLAEANEKLEKYAAYDKYLFSLAESVTGYSTKQDIQAFLHFCNFEVAYIEEYNDYDLTQALEYCFVQYNN